MREVPDVAADADPTTGTAFITDGQLQSGGGTSLATPIWAGFTALIDQFLHNSGASPIGFANPVFYRLAADTQLSPPPFHDVTVGGNVFYQAGAGIRPGHGARESRRRRSGAVHPQHRQERFSDERRRLRVPSTRARRPERLHPRSSRDPLPALPTVECPHCAQVVPEGHFCGSCGAHLLHWNKASCGCQAIPRVRGIPRRAHVPAEHRLVAVPASVAPLAHRLPGRDRAGSSSFWWCSPSQVSSRR